MKLKHLGFAVLMLLWAPPAMGHLNLGLVAPEGVVASDGWGLKSYLEEHLKETVEVRAFPDPNSLHQWMTKLQAIDLAILDADYFSAQPVGQFHSLGTVPSHIAGSSPRLVYVARNGLDSRRLIRLASLLSAGAAVSGSQEEASAPAAVGADEVFSPAADSAVSDSFKPTPPRASPGSQASGEKGPFASEGPVNLEAENLSYDKPSQTYLAEGKVLLQRGALTLEADRVEFRGTSGLATATGNVRIADPQGTMEGDSLSFNINTGEGKITNGRVFVPEKNFHLSGEEIEKFGQWQFRVTDGTYTTCDEAKPAWKFGSGSLDVTMGGYARASNVLFYVRDVPILYFPYMIYPAKTERESGLLLPKYGHSTNRGTLFSLAYYQVIDRNQDATLRADYMSKLGVGSGLEYRYILGADSEGIANLYNVTGIEGEPDMTSADWRHAGTISNGARLITDVDWVSSRDFKEKMGDSYDVYTREAAISVIAGQKNWEKLDLSGQFKYTKELDVNNNRTLQRYPELRLTQVGSRLRDSSLFFRVDAVSDFFERHEGSRGERLMLRPEVSSEYFSNEYFELVPFVGFDQRLYWVDEGTSSHGTPDAGLRMSTVFSRVFHSDSRSVPKLLHRIEPLVEYHYIPNRVDRGLPLFDGLDRVGPQNGLTYALINRFVARVEPEEGDPYDHEFLYLKLSQVYDIRNERNSSGATGQDDAFSPILGEAIFRPTRWSLLDIDLRYDANSGANRFLSYSVLGEIRDAGGNALGINYTFERDLFDYVSTNLTAALLKPFYLGYQLRQDLKGGRTLENQIDLEYRGQCWSVFLTYRDRIQAEEYLVSFSLTGLGRVGSITGRLDRTEQ